MMGLFSRHQSLMSEHNLDADGRQVIHIQWVQLRIQTVLPIDLNIHVAEFLFRRGESRNTILCGGSIVDELTVEVGSARLLV